MRHLLNRTRSAWVGNLALALVASLLVTFCLGGVGAAAAVPQPTGSPTVSQTLSTFNGSPSTAFHISFTVTPTTTPFTPWINVFGPDVLNAGPVHPTVQPQGTSGAYSVVYTVYLSAVNAVVNLVSPNIVGSPYETTSVLYSVYLGVTTPPPPSGTGVAAPVTTTTTSNTVTVGQNQPVGSISSTTTTVGGVGIPAAMLQLNTSQLIQAVSSLGTSTGNLQIQIPTSSVPTGGGTLVNVASGGLSALTTAGKGLEIDTPSGNVTLDPSILSQISSQLPSGDQAQIEVTPLPQSQVSTIVSSATTSGGIYQSGGVTVQVSVNIVNSTGQTVGNFEPTGGTVQLTLPYSSTVSGTDAEKLGIYYYNTSTDTWQYVPGSTTDLTTGTVSAPLTHLSTYAVLLDTQTFPDIQGYWAQSDIEIMIAHHVVDGVSATAFDPTAPVTRGQFALMLARALNLSMPTPSAAPFSDVPTTNPYAGAIAAAVKAGIVDGYPNGTFQPDANISRQELAVMIDRAMAAANQPTTLLSAQIPTLLAPFTDGGQVASWAEQSVAADIQQHIITGVTATTLDPTATTTRAEATVMLQRLMAYLGTL